MDTNDIDEILIEIVKEFTQSQNFNRILQEQVLANAIFYSFAIGTLQSDDSDEEKILSLKYVVDWIQLHEDLIKGFGMKGELDE